MNGYLLWYSPITDKYFKMSHHKNKEVASGTFISASFLQFYTKYFSLTGLSHLTGINKGQLSHYLNGQRNPSKKTIEKIDNSLQLFAKQISQVQLE